MASAPETHSRTDVRSRSSAPASSEHPVHGRHADEERGPPLLDGVEHRDRVELGRKYTGMPAHGQRRAAMAKPMMWATGRAITGSSRWSPVGPGAPSGHAAEQARWVSSAPLGLPVVPDV